MLCLSNAVLFAPIRLTECEFLILQDKELILINNSSAVNKYDFTEKPVHFSNKKV